LLSPCGHTVCNECINKMLNKPEATCFACREKIEKKIINWVILRIIEEKIADLQLNSPESKSTNPADLIKRDTALSFESYVKKLSQLLVTTMRCN